MRVAFFTVTSSVLKKYYPQHLIPQEPLILREQRCPHGATPLVFLRAGNQPSPCWGTKGPRSQYMGHVSTQQGCAVTEGWNG